MITPDDLEDMKDILDKIMSNGHDLLTEYQQLVNSENDPKIAMMIYASFMASILHYMEQILEGEILTRRAIDQFVDLFYEEKLKNKGKKNNGI